MNILLSAYACEPNKGSEPGVGWSWAIELAKHHKVWVLTRDNNKEVIENYIKKNNKNNKNLNFIYVGVSKKLTFWKKGNRGIRLYNTLWQKNAVKIAKKLQENIKFDIVHHVTFVSYTQNTYMYKLGIPMIWGPVAGGENIPLGIGLKTNTKVKIYEKIRNLSQVILKMQVCIINTMKKSKYILVATEETKKQIPNKYLYKTIVMPAIGVEKINPIEKPANDGKIKIVMAGRLIYWKAFDIGIKAFIKVAESNPNLELHILGNGKDKKKLENLCGEYLNKQIYFVDYIAHDEIYKFYSGFDIFLSTTLRDSGCMTMMEAISVGLPCIAIKTGGPGLLIESEKNGAISAESYDSCVNQIAGKIRFFIKDEYYIKKRGKPSTWLEKSDFLLKNKTDLIKQLYLDKEDGKIEN